MISELSELESLVLRAGSLIGEKKNDRVLFCSILTKNNVRAWCCSPIYECGCLIELFTKLTEMYLVKFCKCPIQQIQAIL